MASFHVVADSFWQNVWGAADFDTALTNDSNDKIKNYTTSGFVGEKDNKSSSNTFLDFVRNEKQGKLKHP